MTGSNCGMLSVNQCGRRERLMTGSNCGMVSVNSQCGRRERLMTGSNCGMVSVNSQCGRREAAGWLAALTPRMRFFYLSYPDRRSASPDRVIVFSPSELHALPDRNEAARKRITTKGAMEFLIHYWVSGGNGVDVQEDINLHLILILIPP